MAKLLETERLILRNFLASDLDDYYEYASMENVLPRAGSILCRDKNKAKQELKKKTNKLFNLAIVLKSENKVIGEIELFDYLKGPYALISCALSENYWGYGIMTESIEEIKRYCFEDLGLLAIYTEHLSANTESSRLQDKCGFKVISIRKSWDKWIDGTKTDHVYRKITRQDYLKGKKIRNRVLPKI